MVGSRWEVGTEDEGQRMLLEKKGQSLEVQGMEDRRRTGTGDGKRQTRAYELRVTIY